MGCTPIEILYVWEGRNGRLDDRQRKLFLKNKIVSLLTGYDIKRVQDAVLANRTELKHILKYVQDHKTIPVSKEISFKVLEPGAYLFGGNVYSVRRDSKSKEWQIWTYNERAKKYLRIESSSGEKLLLQRITPKLRLTLESAIKYSNLTGLCCHCGRQLTVIKSVAKGMGPRCAKLYH
jgi:hypothetical protein